jgi:hypothetical protein
MEVVRLSATSISFYQTTRRYSAEDSILHSNSNTRNRIQVPKFNSNFKWEKQTYRFFMQFITESTSAFHVVRLLRNPEVR